MSRTVLRSSKGTKLYAVRKSNGQFSDIQRYKLAHGSDLRHTAKPEKRQRLMGYILAFSIEFSGDWSKETYNRKWDKLWKKIDALKLW